MSSGDNCLKAALYHISNKVCGVKHKLGQNLTQPLSRCVILGESSNFSEHLVFSLVRLYYDHWPE